MLVGNDIVDLHDPWSQPENIHDRFDSRAFTPAERSRIGEGRSGHHLRWSLWAAKESAFKIARKLDRDVKFFPGDFAVRMFDDARAEVTHRVGRFTVWFERADGWVHAVAMPETDPGSAKDTPPAGVGSRVRRVAEDAGGSSDEKAGVRGEAPDRRSRSSERVRDVARAAVGSLMNVCPSDIEIQSDAGIPTLHRAGKRLPVDLSMSHDGRFVACAWSEIGALSG